MSASLESLLEEVAGASARYRARPLTVFDTQVGHRWNRDLMVVGRSVNGWVTCWNPDDANGLAIREAAKRARRALERTDGGCPMLWVTDNWGRKQNNLARSAFWRVTRAVATQLQIADTETPDWPSYIAWANLYRVSPESGWNPSVRLQRIQQEQCAALLAADLERLRPRRLLLLTGIDWAAPFLRRMGAWEPTIEAMGLVEQAGWLTVAGHRVGVVVAKHPMRKPHHPMVQAIAAAWPAAAVNRADAQEGE